MLELSDEYKPTIFGDEVVLRSIDWLENFPWRQDNTTKSHKDKYEIFLNVKDFAPEEITVKTADGLVVVEGKHDEKKDEHGYISRHFVRKYRLPEGCKLESIQSRLTPDGVLVLSAPREFIVKQDKEPTVQLLQYISNNIVFNVLNDIKDSDCLVGRVVASATAEQGISVLVYQNRDPFRVIEAFSVESFLITAWSLELCPLYGNRLTPYCMRLNVIGDKRVYIMCTSAYPIGE